MSHFDVCYLWGLDSWGWICFWLRRDDFWSCNGGLQGRLHLLLSLDLRSRRVDCLDRRYLGMLCLYLWLFHGCLRNRHLLVNRGLVLAHCRLDNRWHLRSGVFRCNGVRDEKIRFLTSWIKALFVRLGLNLSVLVGDLHRYLLKRRNVALLRLGYIWFSRWRLLLNNQVVFRLH